MNILSHWADQPAPWLQSPGTSDGIVISSRLRFARNVQGFRFRRTLSGAERESLVNELLGRLAGLLPWQEALAASMDDLNQSQRLFLVERHLASSELANGGAQSGIMLRSDGLASVMLGEEDHIRLQTLQPGLSIHDCLQQAQDLDRHLHHLLPWASNQSLGFLTSCPTNLGTGMRASVMLHLPGLAESKELPRMLRALNKLHLTARGMNGEGSEARGHFYQISNQRTLGASCESICNGLHQAICDIVTYEQACRHALGSHRRLYLEDHIWRAWAILRHARRLGFDELIEHLAWLRFAVDLGLLPTVLWPTLDLLLITTQRAHLQLRDSKALDARERDIWRAQLVRDALQHFNERGQPTTDT